jgi:beta-glucosidase
VPTEALTPPGGKGTGLLGEYWNGEAPDGQPALTVVDPTVDTPRAPDGLTGAVWSARWTGTITPTADGPHRFTVLAAGITRLEIDGHLVATGEREFGQVFGGPPLPVSGMVDLRAGQPVGIRLDYSSATAWPVLAPGGRRRQPPVGLAAAGHADPGGRATGRRLRRRRGVRQRRRG